MDPTLEDTIIADTRRWLERAVIGLNLCPFAKGVEAKGQIHFAVSRAQDERGADQFRQSLVARLPVACKRCMHGAVSGHGADKQRGVVPQQRGGDVAKAFLSLKLKKDCKMC